MSTPWYRGRMTTMARPSRPASRRMPSRPSVRPSISIASPTSNMRCGHVPSRCPARQRNPLCVRHLDGPPRARRRRRRIRRSPGWRKATGSTSPRPATRTVQACRLATSRSQEGPDLRFPARWLGWRRPRSPQGAARRDATEHRRREAVRPLRPDGADRTRRVELQSDPSTN